MADGRKKQGQSQDGDEKKKKKKKKKEELKKVLGNPLVPLPNTAQQEGFYQDNLCHSPPTSHPRADFSVAATLTHSFLQSEFGDDPPYKGHRAGQTMCISAHDFRSAMREMGPDTGVKVLLESTSERARWRWWRWQF